MELIRDAEFQIKSMTQYMRTSEGLLKDFDADDGEYWSCMEIIHKATESKVNQIEEKINVLQEEKRCYEVQLKSNIKPFVSITFGLRENTNTAFVLGS